MTFLKTKKVIEEGDLVLIYITRNQIRPVYVTKDEELNTRFGSFPHNSMIGLPFGSQISTPKGKGFVYLLQPTPELWTLSLPHRTQIVYTPDSSYIMQRLNVKNGSRVIEAGTGSGSFTHAFSRACGMDGKVFSFEFHEPRYIQAKEEFTKHGLENTIITHRDVCNGGFGIEGVELNAQVIFLDLPSPWDAIKHIDGVSAKGEMVGVCCFSPCIEQVVKTVEALEQEGWINIEMTAIEGRLYEAHKAMKRDVSDAVKRLQYVKQKQIEGLEKIRQGIHLKKSEEKDYGFNPFGRGKRVLEGEEGYEWFDVSRNELEVKTHTSYLTFAFKIMSA